jgi:hypothetical protein
MVPVIPVPHAAQGSTSAPQAFQGMHPNIFLNTTASTLDTGLVWHAPYSGPGQGHAPREWNFVWSRARRQKPKAVANQGAPSSPTSASGHWTRNHASSTPTACELCHSPLKTSIEKNSQTRKESIITAISSHPNTSFSDGKVLCHRCGTKATRSRRSGSEPGRRANLMRIDNILNTEEDSSELNVHKN